MLLDWLLYNSITFHKSCLLTPYTCAKEALLESDTLCHGGKGSLLSAHCQQHNSELSFIWLIEPLQCVKFVHACCLYIPLWVHVMNELKFELWTCGQLSWKWAQKKSCQRHLYIESVPNLWYSWQTWCSLHITINIVYTSFCNVCRVGFNIATDDALISARALITILHMR